MRMTDEEIVRDYRASKAPFKQIGILADLNGCTRQAIADVLIEAGLDVPSRFVRVPFTSEQAKAVLEDETAEVSAKKPTSAEPEPETGPEAEAAPDDGEPECDDEVPVEFAMRVVAGTAALRSIRLALDDLDETASTLGVEDVGHYAIVFAERVRGILMMFEDIKERCGR